VAKMLGASLRRHCPPPLPLTVTLIPRLSSACASFTIRATQQRPVLLRRQALLRHQWRLGALGIDDRLDAYRSLPSQLSYDCGPALCHPCGLITVPVVPTVSLMVCQPLPVMTLSCASRMLWSTAVPEGDGRHRVRGPRRDAVGGVALLGRLWFGIRRLSHGLG
jgi:hypothetical protein